MRLPDFNSTTIVHVTKETDFYRLKQVFLDYATSIDFNLYYQNFIKELSTIDELYSPPHGMACILWHEYEVIGGLGVRIVSPGVARVNHIHVLSRYKRPIFVKKLLNVAIEWARQKGLQKIYMEPADALPWISKLSASAGLDKISIPDTAGKTVRKHAVADVTPPIYYSCYMA